MKVAKSYQKQVHVFQVLFLLVNWLFQQVNLNQISVTLVSQSLYKLIFIYTRQH